MTLTKQQQIDILTSEYGTPDDPPKDGESPQQGGGIADTGGVVDIEGFRRSAQKSIQPAVDIPPVEPTIKPEEFTGTNVPPIRPYTGEAIQDKSREFTRAEAELKTQELQQATGEMLNLPDPMESIETSEIKASIAKRDLAINAAAAEDTRLIASGEKPPEQSNIEEITRARQANENKKKSVGMPMSDFTKLNDYQSLTSFDNADGNKTGIAELAVEKHMPIFKKEHPRLYENLINGTLSVSNQTKYITGPALINERNGLIDDFNILDARGLGANDPEMQSIFAQYTDIQNVFGRKLLNAAGDEDYVYGSTKEFATAVAGTLRSLDNTAKTIFNFTGLDALLDEDHEGAFKMAADWIIQDVADLPDMPDTFAGQALGTTIGVLELMAELRMVPALRSAKMAKLTNGLVQGIPSLVTLEATKGFVNTYNEGNVNGIPTWASLQKTAGETARGAATGLLYHAIGFGSGELAKFAKAIPYKAAPVAVGVGSGAGAFTLLEAFTQWFHDEEVDWSRALASGVGMIPLGLPALTKALRKDLSLYSEKKLWTSSPEILKMASKLKQEPKKLIEDIGTLQKLIKIEDNPIKKRQLIDNQQALKHMFMIKTLQVDVAANPNKWRRSVELDRNMSPENKAYHYKQIEQIVKEAPTPKVDADQFNRQITVTEILRVQQEKFGLENNNKEGVNDAKIEAAQKQLDYLNQQLIEIKKITGEPVSEISKDPNIVDPAMEAAKRKSEYQNSLDAYLESLNSEAPKLVFPKDPEEKNLQIKMMENSIGELSVKIVDLKREKPESVELKVKEQQRDHLIRSAEDAKGEKFEISDGVKNKEVQTYDYNMQGLPRTKNDIYFDGLILPAQGEGVRIKSVEALKEVLNSPNHAIISAERPGTMEENMKRTVEIENDPLLINKQKQRAGGRYGSQPKVSFVINDIPVEKAIEVAQKYDQDAVIVDKAMIDIKAGIVYPETGTTVWEGQAPKGDITRMNINGKGVNIRTTYDFNSGINLDSYLKGREFDKQDIKKEAPADFPVEKQFNPISDKKGTKLTGADFIKDIRKRKIEAEKNEKLSEESGLVSGEGKDKLKKEGVETEGDDIILYETTDKDVFNTNSSQGGVTTKLRIPAKSIYDVNADPFGIMHAAERIAGFKSRGIDELSGLVKVSVGPKGVDVKVLTEQLGEFNPTITKKRGRINIEIKTLDTKAASDKLKELGIEGRQTIVEPQLRERAIPDITIANEAKRIAQEVGYKGVIRDTESGRTVTMWEKPSSDTRVNQLKNRIAENTQELANRMNVIHQAVSSGKNPLTDKGTLSLMFDVGKDLAELAYRNGVDNIRKYVFDNLNYKYKQYGVKPEHLKAYENEIWDKIGGEVGENKYQTNVKDPKIDQEVITDKVAKKKLKLEHEIQMAANIEKGQVKSAKNQVRQKIMDRRAEIDLAAYETNLLVDNIKRNTSERQRELMPFLLEKTRPPDELNRPDLQELYDREQDPDFAYMPHITEQVRGYYDKMWEKMKENYDLTDNEGVRDYVTHIWETGSKNRSGATHLFSTNTKFAKKRYVETLTDGIKRGLVPKNLDIGSILETYSRGVNRAIANKKFADEMKKFEIEGVKMIKSEAEAPKGWVTTDHPAFSKKMYVPTADGKLDQIRDRPYMTHPEFKKYLDIVLSAPDIGTAGRAYDQVAGLMKKSALSLSLFHHGALIETGVALLGPVKATKAIGKITGSMAQTGFSRVMSKVGIDVLEGKKPAFEKTEIAEDGVAHGLQLGASADIPVAKIQEMLNTVARKTKKIPIIGNITKLVKTFNHNWDAALWDYVHDGLKLYGYEHLKSKIPEGLEGAELKAAKQEAAGFVNDSFGGQNMDALMINPKTAKMMGRFLLSPDWTISTARQALSVTGLGIASRIKTLDKHTALGSVGGTKEARKARAKIGGMFWLKAALYYGVGMNALNVMMRNKDIEENPHLYPKDMSLMDKTMFGNTSGHKTHLFVGRTWDGFEDYMRWGKQFRELPEFIMNPLKKIGGKANPLLTAFSEHFTGSTLSEFKNRDIAGKKGMERFKGHVKTIATSGLPFSMRKLIHEDQTFLQNLKNYNPVNVAFPSSKGKTAWSGLEDFKEVLRPVFEPGATEADFDESAIEEIYIESWRNNLNPESMLEAALSSVKSERTRSLTEDYKEVAAIEEALLDDDLSKADKGRLKRLKRRLDDEIKKQGESLENYDKVLRKIKKDIEDEGVDMDIPEIDMKKKMEELKTRLGEDMKDANKGLESEKEKLKRKLKEKMEKLKTKNNRK